MIAATIPATASLNADGGADRGDREIPSPAALSRSRSYAPGGCGRRAPRSRTSAPAVSPPGWFRIRVGSLMLVAALAVPQPPPREVAGQTLLELLARAVQP